ncbi:hypothetical protein GCM10009665_38720 [Kitasatospora nipponensis]|uniref:Zinc finger protein n=1 Tax=Kitasatospora nipponensis TaxID=258049 RepID=A0ABP4H2M6_9ACTN
MEDYEMRAEHEDGDPHGAILHWHMVRDRSSQAMCGRDISPDAASQSPDAWGTEAAQPFCHSCGAAYLRQVPLSTGRNP